MADENAKPSIDPADQDSMVGTLRLAFRKMLMGVDGMLPARVIAYQRTPNNVATVQPLIMIGDTSGNKMSRAQIENIPVLAFGAGGFLMSFNVKPGDMGWILASDRDISLFLQGMREDWPNTKRLKSFSDGMFIPDAMRNWALADEDQENAVFQSTDGSIKISLGENFIKLKHPTQVIAETPLLSVPNGDVVASGVSLVNHLQSGVQSGNATSGKPVPSA